MSWLRLYMYNVVILTRNWIQYHQFMLSAHKPPPHLQQIPSMDGARAKQVCTLMGWDLVNIKISHPAPRPVTS